MEEPVKHEESHRSHGVHHHKHSHHGDSTHHKHSHRGESSHHKHRHHGESSHHSHSHSTVENKSSKRNRWKKLKRNIRHTWHKIKPKGKVGKKLEAVGKKLKLPKPVVRFLRILAVEFLISTAVVLLYLNFVVYGMEEFTTILGLLVLLLYMGYTLYRYKTKVGQNRYYKMYLGIWAVQFVISMPMAWYNLEPYYTFLFIGFKAFYMVNWVSKPVSTLLVNLLLLAEVLLMPRFVRWKEVYDLKPKKQGWLGKMRKRSENRKKARKEEKKLRKLQRQYDKAHK